MKKVLLALALLGFASGAMADPADLSGGCFIAHYCEPIGYSSDAPALGWCGEYDAMYAITDHTQQINRIDVPDFLPASWFVIAAWDDEEKEWCGTEFGFGAFDAGLFIFGEWNPCYPATGGLEIPTAGWPGPMEGVAFVVTGDPWFGNYKAVAHFGGYAYGYYGANGIVPLAVDPPTAFAGFSNCAAPPEAFTVDADRLGALGINTDGIYVQPAGYVPPTGACCIGYDCFIYTEEECIGMQGEWLGPDTVCEPNPCLPEGACCLEEPVGMCQVMLEENCMLVGGEWIGPETTCEPNPCAGEYVCCIGHDCVIVGTQMDCDALGGIFLVDLYSCEPNPCEEFTPVNDASWGTIKGMYR
jgi:hypothetical protein